MRPKLIFRNLDLLEQGEEIVIVRHGEPVAQLIRTQKGGRPQLGAMRGEFSWTEGWDKPMTDEEADAFWAGRG